MIGLRGIGSERADPFRPRTAAGVCQFPIGARVASRREHWIQSCQTGERIPALLTARKVVLGNPSSAVRAGAARALIPLESHDAIPALFAALDDESAIVSFYAEEALWRLGVGMVLFKP